MGRIAGETVKDMRKRTLKEFFEDQEWRVRERLNAAMERVLIARRNARRNHEDGEDAIELRGHAHGHDAGPDWRERNL